MGWYTVRDLKRLSDASLDLFLRLSPPLSLAHKVCVCVSYQTIFEVREDLWLSASDDDAVSNDVTGLPHDVEGYLSWLARLPLLARLSGKRFFGGRVSAPPLVRYSDVAPCQW